MANSGALVVGRGMNIEAKFVALAVAGMLAALAILLLIRA
jgi:hypothetical protein